LQFPITYKASRALVTATLDLLSAADLSAGVVVDYLDKLATTSKPLLKVGAEPILEWLGRDGVGLKKHIVLLQQEGHSLASSAIRITSDDVTGEARYVPLRVKRI
jgi:hypothetical protein